MTIASMALLAKEGALYTLNDRQLAEGGALVLHLREQVDAERLRRALGAERAETSLLTLRGSDRARASPRRPTVRSS